MKVARYLIPPSGVACRVHIHPCEQVPFDMNFCSLSLEMAACAVWRACVTQRFVLLLFPVSLKQSQFPHQKQRYMAAAQAVRETLWLKELLAGLGMSFIVKHANFHRQPQKLLKH